MGSGGGGGTSPGPLEQAIASRLPNLFDTAQGQANRIINQMFSRPGGFNPFEQQGVEGTQRFANVLLPQFQEQLGATRLDPGQFAGRNLQSLINQDLTGQNDQVTRNLIASSIDPVRREFLETVLPRLGASEQQQQGGPGGTRGGLIAAQSGQRFLQDIGNLSSQITANQRQQNVANALQAAGLLEGQQLGRAQFERGRIGQAAELAQAGPEALFGLGEFQQERELLPLQILSGLSSILSGVGTGTPTQSAPRRNRLRGALGGAVAGAPGGPAGAIAGALAGAFL